MGQMGPGQGLPGQLAQVGCGASGRGVAGWVGASGPGVAPVHAGSARRVPAPQKATGHPDGPVGAAWQTLS